MVGIAGLLLWNVAMGDSAYHVGDVPSPDYSCSDLAVPLFEPTDVELARVIAWPPLVRCTLVDPRYPTGDENLWTAGDLAFLAVVDVAAVALMVAVLRR